MKTSGLSLFITYGPASHLFHPSQNFSIFFSGFILGVSTSAHFLLSYHSAHFLTPFCGLVTVYNIQFITPLYWMANPARTTLFYSPYSLSCSSYSLFTHGYSLSSSSCSLPYLSFRQCCSSFILFYSSYSLSYSFHS